MKARADRVKGYALCDTPRREGSYQAVTDFDAFDALTRADPGHEEACKKCAAKVAQLKRATGRAMVRRQWR